MAHWPFHAVQFVVLPPRLFPTPLPKHPGYRYDVSSSSLLQRRLVARGSYALRLHRYAFSSGCEEVQTRAHLRVLGSRGHYHLPHGSLQRHHRHLIHRHRNSVFASHVWVLHFESKGIRLCGQGVDESVKYECQALFKPKLSIHIPTLAHWSTMGSNLAWFFA